MKKYFCIISLLAAFASPAFSDSVTVLGGYLLPGGDSDVYKQNEQETTFEVSDLNDFALTGRYDHFLGDFINIGASLSGYEGHTVVEDRDFEFENGQPIFRDIRLQIVPLEANLHFLPAGRNDHFIPYLGGGVGVYFWEYEEFGDFVIDRFTDPTIINGSAFSDGGDFGWHVEGGLYIPVSHSIAVAAEAKYFDSEGDLDVRGFDPAFEPIDLSATVFSGGISFWF